MVMDKCVAYNYVEHKKTNEPAFKITEGKFEGAVWNYKKVKMPLYGDDGNMIDLEEVEHLVLTFEYEVLYNPTDEDLTTDEFRNVIGDILLEVIDASLEHDTVQFNTKNRNSNTE